MDGRYPAGLHAGLAAGRRRGRGGDSFAIRKVCGSAPDDPIYQGAALLLVAGFEIWRLLYGGYRTEGGSTDLSHPFHFFHERPNLAGIEMIREARALTDPNEFVMDSKGETIYRPRPYWYVLESLTRKRLLSGTLEDEMPQRMISTRTAVSTISNRMTPASRNFVSEHYVAVGLLRVLGQVLAKSGAGEYEFEVIVPERYTLMTSRGEVPTGLLDGQPFTGPRVLEPGKHQFHQTESAGTIAFVWARAVERGFSPFRPPANLPADYLTRTSNE